jgi:hypothetical protein
MYRDCTSPGSPTCNWPGSLEHAAQQEVGALTSLRLDDAVEGLEPLTRLDRVAVGQLALEPDLEVEVEAL